MWLAHCEGIVIFRIRVRIAKLFLAAAEKLAYLSRKVAPR